MIDFQNVSKTYGAQAVLESASFRVNEGERVGLVGPNGAGKSTIFQLISGDMSPDGGDVVLPQRARLGYVHQEVGSLNSQEPLLDYAQGGHHELHTLHERIETLEHGFHDDTMTPQARARALEELGDLQTRFEALGGYDFKSRAEAALSGLGFAEHAFRRPISELSGGWQMRAELARTLVPEPTILLLDEPSNYLDVPAIEWLQRFLRDFKGTLLLISHDRFLLNSLTDVTIEVANAHTTRYAGNYDRYVEQRRLRYEQQLAARRNEDRKREQAERFIERFRAKNTKASQVQSKLKQLEKMQTTAVMQNVVSRGTIRLRAPQRSGQEVVRLEQAGYAYDGRTWVLRHVDMRIERGDKIALVGLNGLGKTTLLRLLGGQLEPGEGKRYLGHNVVTGYQSQDFTETMVRDRTVFETVKQAGGMPSDQEVRTLLGSFGFSGDTVEKHISVLSGGEKVRVAFARLLMNPPNFLLLDEPTTHLDIPAREALETALARFEGTICLVSHDIEFIRHVATTVYAMQPPGIKRYWGGYDYYREKLAQEQAELAAPAAAATRPGSARKEERRERAARQKDFTRKRRAIEKNMSHEEKRIETLQAERDTLVQTLSDAHDEVDYAAVNKRLAEIQQQLSDRTRRWEAFAIELDELERGQQA